MLKSLGLTLAAVALAGCASTTASSTESESASPSAARYATMTDLTDAFVAAGGICEDPQDGPEVSDLVDEAVICGFRNDVLTLYKAGAFPAEDAGNLITVMREDGTDGGAVYGPNWLVITTNADEAKALEGAMGGTAVVNVGTAPGMTAHTRMEYAAGACKLQTGTTANFGDEGLTLTLSGNMLFSMQECILNELDVPDSVLAQIGATRALDGMQRAEWGTVKATWTYHPDDGLDLILTSTD